MIIVSQTALSFNYISEFICENCRKYFFSAQESADSVCTAQSLQIGDVRSWR